MKRFLAVAAFVASLGIGASAMADSVGSKIMLWPANRIMDALDVFSISAGMGNTVRIELMGSEYCKGGGGIGWVGSLVKDYNRQYGVGVRNGWYWALISTQQEAVERIGVLGSVKSYQQDFIGIPSPTEDVVYDFYDGERDFWRLGGALGLMVEGEVYLHPVEVADLITGIFFIDLRGDDYTIEDFQ